MNVDPNSWHAKMYRYWAGDTLAKPNLCKYFWVVCLFAPLHWAIEDGGHVRFTTSTYILTTIVMTVIASPLTLLEDGPSFYEVLELVLMVTTMMWGVFIVLFSIVSVISWSIDRSQRSYTHEAHRRRIRRRGVRRQRWHLLRSYLRAKKDKVCPIIEFDDDNDLVQESADDVGAG